MKKFVTSLTVALTVGSGLFAAAPVEAQAVAPFPIPVLDKGTTAPAKARIPFLPPILPYISPSSNPLEYCTLYVAGVYKDGPGHRWAQGEAGNDCWPPALDLTITSCILRTWPSTRLAFKCSDPVYFPVAALKYVPTPRMGLDGNYKFIVGDYEGMARFTGTWKGKRFDITKRGPKRFLTEYQG